MNNPIRYIVFDRERLHEILSTNTSLSTVDQLKVTIMRELMNDKLTLTDVMHLFAKYGIDYQCRRAVIDIKQTVAHTHELPAQVSFVTMRRGEVDTEWDCKVYAEGSI